MKRIHLFPILFSIAIAVFLSSPGAAQEPNAIEARRAQNARQRIPRRPNLLAELGLSPEQIAKIKQINTDRKPQMAEAQLRMLDANRALDAAIYADAADNAEVDARLRDFQAAQAEVARIRFNSELAIRNVLNAEQLARFRELRQKFSEYREDARERRQERRLQRRKRGTGPTQIADPDF